MTPLVTSLTLPSLPLAVLQIWLTPLWLLSVGVTLGLLLALVVYGVLWVVNRTAADQVQRAIGESVLMPALYLGGAMAAFAVFASPQMPVEEVIASLRRLPSAGELTETITLDPRSEDVELTLSLVGEEINRYEINSSEDVRVAAEPGAAFSAPFAVVQGDEPYLWNTKSKLARGLRGQVDTVYLTNEGDAPAEVTLTFNSEVRTPEVRQTPVAALTVLGILVAYVLLGWLAPNVANIATATSKEAIGQPMFLLFVVCGAIALFCFIYIPYNTFGEDVKMLKDSGLSTIMVLAILFAVWTASVSIADEIEGKTALTLLSKPISRRQFIIGKYVGIMWAVLLMFLLLGAVFLATISYKVVYDARETSNPTPDWQACNEVMIGAAPGLVLSFFEAATLAAVSVAISTRLPMLPNLVICGAVYAIGHLTPQIVKSSVGNNEFVEFFARLVAVVLPVLDNYKIEGAIAAGLPVPAEYLWWAPLYTLVYIVIALLFALTLFEDRDMA